MAAPVLAYENLGRILGAGWLFRRTRPVHRRARPARTDRPQRCGQDHPVQMPRRPIKTTKADGLSSPAQVVLLEQDRVGRPVRHLPRVRASAVQRPRPTSSTRSAEQLGIALDRPRPTASGPRRRRAAIARALAQVPDGRLLDEPMNDLDLGAIEWLEACLGAGIMAPSSRTAMTAPSRRPDPLVALARPGRASQGGDRLRWLPRLDRAALCRGSPQPKSSTPT